MEKKIKIIKKKEIKINGEDVTERMNTLENKWISLKGPY